MASVKPSNPIIDWGNPITKGLVFCMPLSEGAGQKPMEITTNTPGSFAGSPLPVWGKNLYGTRLRYDGAGSGGGAVYWTAKSKNRGLLVYTVEAIINMTGGGGGNAGTYFRNTDNTNTMMTLRCWDGSANSISFTHRFTIQSPTWRITGLTAGVTYHIVVSYDANNTSNVPTMYVNGRSVSYTTFASPSGTADAVSDTQYIVGNINQTGNVGTRTWQGDINYVNMWNRILTPTEVKQLYTDPWCIYQKPKFRMGYQTASSSIKKFSSIAQASIKKVSGITLANIKKISGIAD